MTNFFEAFYFFGVKILDPRFQRRLNLFENVRKVWGLQFFLTIGFTSHLVENKGSKIIALIQFWPWEFVFLTLKFLIEHF